MKAAVSAGVRQGFRVHDVEIAQPVGREVLIDVKASGLCHSDLHLIENDFGFLMPAVFGHEVAGVITKIGPDVTTMKPGDHVVACLIRFCGTATRACPVARSIANTRNRPRGMAERPGCLSSPGFGGGSVRPVPSW